VSSGDFEPAVLSYAEDCHAVMFLKAPSLIPRMPHIPKITARHPQKLFSYASDVMGIIATSNGEPPGVLHCLGEQNLPDKEDLTDSAPSLVNKAFPSINNFLAGDLQVPELLGQQQVSLQGIHHEHFDLKNQAHILSLAVPFGWSHVCSLVIPCLSLVPLPSLLHLAH